MSVGIQETKEVLVAVDEVALELVKGFRDGVQFTDFVTFWEDYKNNADFQAKLKAAWDNHQAIPAEIGDLDISEFADLAMTEVAYVPKFIAAIVGA